MDDSVKIVFEPGCFDDFQGTQEELDELVAMILKMAESGELLEATAIDLDNLPDDVAEWMAEEFGTGADPEERRKRLN